MTTLLGREDLLRRLASHDLDLRLARREARLLQSCSEPRLRLLTLRHVDVERTRELRGEACDAEGHLAVHMGDDGTSSAWTSV